MKTITQAILAAAILTTSSLAFAGTPQMVSSSESASLQRIGVVSSGGFTSLDELAASLNMKAADAGATHYHIIGTSGNNKLDGTAILYR